jgi:hypothetical protein
MVVLLWNIQPFIPIIFCLLFHFNLSLDIQFDVLFCSVSDSDHPSQLKALWNGEVIGEYERGHLHEFNQSSTIVPVCLLNSQFHFSLYLYMTVSTTTSKASTENYDPRWTWKRTFRSQVSATSPVSWSQYSDYVHSFTFHLHLSMTVNTTTSTEYYNHKWIWKRTFRWVQPAQFPQSQYCYWAYSFHRICHCMC